MNLRDLFKSFIGKDDIISVYCNPDEADGAVVGITAQIDDNHFIVNEITKSGEYDGYGLRKTDEIFRIDYDSGYERSLFKAAAHNGVKHEKIPDNGSVIMNFIKFAKDSGFVVSVGIRDYSTPSVTGYITDIDGENETFTIHVITFTKDGGFDGFTAVNFKDVYRMSCDDTYDRYFGLLNKLAVS